MLSVRTSQTNLIRSRFENFMEYRFKCIAKSADSNVSALIEKTEQCDEIDVFEKYA